MKKTTLLFGLLLTATIVMAQENIAVFVYSTTQLKESTNALRSRMVSALHNNAGGRYTVVDRSAEFWEIQKMELGHQASGHVSDKELVAVGKQLGADKVCGVVITYYSEDGYFFECKILDVEKNQLEGQAEYPRVGKGENYIHNIGIATSQMVAASLAEQLDMGSIGMREEAKKINSHIDMTIEMLGTQEGYDPPRAAGVPYDVNTDTRMDAEDAAAVCNYLLYADPVGDPEAGDMNADGRYSAADLTLIKRVLLAAGQPAETALPEPPIRALNPSLPSVGTERIPVFAAEFPDCTFAAPDIAEVLENRVFGKIFWNRTEPPFDSVSAYLSRASYGRLRLTGDVFVYTAEHPIDWYAADNAKSLVDEILTDYDAMLDYRTYDADKNGILDSLVIALPDDALKIDSDGDRKPDWWPFSIDAYSQKTYDGVRAGQFCVIPYQVQYSGEFVSQTAHELCHAMGLPDYYLPATETAGDEDGLPGEAGTELMDEGGGDLSVCSKLLLGWLAEDEIQVYTGGTQAFVLKPSQNTPSCILIPKNPDAGFLSEYFLIEYVVRTGNQLNSFGSGIRILHVNAAVSEGDFGMELTYQSNGRHYDGSHQKQRVLRLVNEKGCFYPDDRNTQYAGYTDTIDGSTEGFR